MSDELKLHVLTRGQVAEGSCYAGWDESVCAARLTPEKSQALLSNPLAKSDDEPMQVIGTRGNLVIGRIDFVAGELLVDGVRAPILWGSAFYVPPEERKRLMGAMILMKASGVYHTLGANGPSQMALPLYEKLKWNKVPLQRWIGLRRSGSIVRRYVGDGPLGGLTRLAADAGLAGLRAVNAARRSLSAPGLRARRVSEMPSELESSLNRSTAGVRGHRSAAWFNWLLRSQFEPQRHHERALFLIESSGGRALGYFLLKVKFHAVATHRAFPDLTLATLADWGIFESGGPSARTAMLLACREAWKLGADALELCTAPGDDTWGHRLMGFLPAGTMNYMWRATRPSVLAEEKYKNPSLWRLTYADGENVPG